jgi:hypothetical protein
MAPESIAAHRHEQHQLPPQQHDAESPYFSSSTRAGATSCNSNLLDGRYAFNSGPAATPLCNERGGAHSSGSESSCGVPPLPAATAAAAHLLHHTTAPFDAYAHQNPSTNNNLNPYSPVKALFFKIEFLDSKEFCPNSPAKSFSRNFSQLFFVLASKELEPSSVRILLTATIENERGRSRDATAETRSFDIAWCYFF